MRSILDYYKYVHSACEIIPPHIPVAPEELCIGKVLVPDVKSITLAQYDPDTKNYITAHKISDYRKNKFSVRLLPKVNPLFNKVLEGSKYWYAKLHNEG